MLSDQQTLWVAFFSASFSAFVCFFFDSSFLLFFFFHIKIDSSIKIIRECEPFFFFFHLVLVILWSMRMAWDLFQKLLNEFFSSTNRQQLSTRTFRFLSISRSFCFSFLFRFIPFVWSSENRWECDQFDDVMQCHCYRRGPFFSYKKCDAISAQRNSRRRSFETWESESKTERFFSRFSIKSDLLHIFFFLERVDFSSRLFFSSWFYRKHLSLVTFIHLPDVHKRFKPFVSNPINNG